MSKLREWLERAKLTGGKDAASFARVQAACVAIMHALDTVPGLTEAERAQALMTLGSHQTMRNVMTSGILSELGKKAPPPTPAGPACTCFEVYPAPHAPNCARAGLDDDKAEGARRGRE